MYKHYCFQIILTTLILSITSLRAETIGSVDTKFNLLTPDDTINIEVFDDPKINGVSCYLSRANKGGIKGTLGLAEETSDASIDCRQVGPISWKEELQEGESVFKIRRSVSFKKLQVVRFWDKKRNTLIYLVYSDKLIDGSPQNSITAVPIMPWSNSSTKTTNDKNK
ncbi:MAG: CreA family protein [Methylococcaceae bacterium]|nr:CreA family protein [Methylococcaceae bacterium]